MGGLHIHIHIHDHADSETKEALSQILKKLDKMPTQAELAQQITQLTEQVNKTKTEIQGKLSELETAIQNAGNTTPEVDAALAGLKSAVQGVDDIVPDAPAGGENNNEPA